MNLNEVIPLCINSIYLRYYTIPSTQHKSQSYRYMFRLNKSSSGVSKNQNYRRTPPSPIHRKLKNEKTENHDGPNQDHENNGPKKQHTRHHQYTRRYNST